MCFGPVASITRSMSMPRRVGLTSDFLAGWRDRHRCRSRVRTTRAASIPEPEPQPERLQPVLGERLARPKLAATDGIDVDRIRCEVLTSYLVRVELFGMYTSWPKTGKCLRTLPVVLPETGAREEHDTSPGQGVNRVALVRNLDTDEDDIRQAFYRIERKGRHNKGSPSAFHGAGTLSASDAGGDGLVGVPGLWSSSPAEGQSAEPGSRAFFPVQAAGLTSVISCSLSLVPTASVQRVPIPLRVGMTRSSKAGLRRRHWRHSWVWTSQVASIFEGDPQPRGLHPVLGERLPRPKLAAFDGNDATASRLEELTSRVERVELVGAWISWPRTRKGLANSASGSDGNWSPRTT
ncbi:hypothetical protein MRX96_052411 [Rhipicephalus microplus]